MLELANNKLNLNLNIKCNKIKFAWLVGWFVGCVLAWLGNCPVKIQNFIDGFPMKIRIFIGKLADPRLVWTSPD